MSHQLERAVGRSVLLVRGGEAKTPGNELAQTMEAVPGERGVREHVRTGPLRAVTRAPDSLKTVAK